MPLFCLLPQRQPFRHFYYRASRINLNMQLDGCYVLFGSLSVKKALKASTAFADPVSRVPGLSLSRHG